jgi:hypothetical protein
MRAAEKRRVQHAGIVYIVNEAPAPAQKRAVLDALHAPADEIARSVSHAAFLTR